MLIKITDKCNMGCSHCLSDCTPNLHDMEWNTFIDAMLFYNKYCKDVRKPIIISGGEPTESKIFYNVISELISYTLLNIPITITTNGIWLSENEQVVKDLKKYLPACTIQIVVDDRYYPIHVNEDSPIFNYDNVILCRDVLRIYPQGRAIQNNLSFEAKSSKCFNIRAITKQMVERGIPNLSTIFNTMTMHQKFCTPHIDIDGNIKLGESRLCPVCSNICKTEKEIIDDIINFKCHQCDFLNENLPSQYKRFVE